MFEKLKRILVESFVGAIALGYLLAQCILNFVNIFTAPVSVWVTKNQYREFMSGSTASARFSLRPALPELVTSFLLVLLWYVLLRWLYFKPLKKEPSEAAPNPEQTA
jgi:hypothetical protein